ncbi:uncharacterized protein LAESUDRAFT_702851 [Laetiporus sulphureus 93-53]|uniref:Fungal-type protein kinase domain-containing protein n=1 Tax=Laetiporus sulphureus 93-53 TaxID=1314785 RepID=A0A165DHN4_9APHY|nr:uncharacterized protein LAESUDRAFT_702851 [Laetiporus sulphureus 93-53]KZT04902.1 hypothetical protein LAESUDRAFT_702851 [Laetiporus sulphureus 93-53]
MHVDGNQKNAGIAMLFPGRSKISTPVPQWQDICLMLQYKSSPSDDPISQIRSSGQVEEGCFIQLFQAAQNMLAANRSLFVFVIGLYGSMAKIFRFDHSAVVASPSFSYLARPNMLREFLWRFVNPAAGGTVVGSDPSITIPTSDDLQWATSILRDRELPVEVLGSSRWYTVEPPTRGVTPRQFLAFRPIDVHTALFSRATMVWEVLGRGEESGQTYVLKDAWRAVWSNVETGFYERIRRSLATGEELFGIADMICGTDLGGLEISRAMRDPATPSVKLEASEVDLRNATEKSSRHTRAAKRRHAERPSVMNANAPCHRTISSFGNLGRHPKDDRTHMRLVFRPLGRPLEDFKDTKELAQVLRDAIIGHRQVYKAGILHRDVSIDNIMIANGQPYKGFITDFDMSAFCTGIERGGKTVSFESP